MPHRRNLLHRRNGSEREHGQVLVLFALSLVVILVFASIAIDLGVLRNNKQILVNTLDAAALAGGTKMPVDGSGTGGPAAVAAVKNIIDSTIQADYPGLPTSGYEISYRCLIGVDSNGLPDISEVPAGVCNPAKALGHTPVLTSDFVGTGSNRYSACRPDLGDKCNVVVVTGSATTNYGFGGAVGITSGSTGVIQSASCNGPCGPAAIPVDLVIIMDRTLSMTGNGPNTEIAAIQGGASAALSVFDPKLQRVALGTIGPSIIGTAGCPNQSSAFDPAPPGIPTQVLATGQSDVNDFSTLDKWVPVGFSGKDSGSPGVKYSEVYSANGVTNPNSTIWKAISCLTSFSAGTNLDTPIAMAQQYLQTYGRSGVKKGIILETDGAPQAGDGSAYYTCDAANAAAKTAKDAGIEIFTIGFGVGSVKCPQKPGQNTPNCSGSTGTNSNETADWSCQLTSALLLSMATDASHAFTPPKGTDYTALIAAFKQSAIDLAAGGLRLVSATLTPIVTSVSPATGSHSGGTSVTITGQFFTGAYGVTFGGTGATFTVNSDTTITATAPAGSVGTVDVMVATPGGTSTITSADHYTYN